MHRYPTRYRLAMQEQPAPAHSLMPSHSPMPSTPSPRETLTNYILLVFLVILSIRLFNAHFPPVEHKPNDPLTALFYDVSAHHLAHHVDCTFVMQTLDRLPAAVQISSLIQTLPIYRAVAVYIEASLAQWSARCLTR